jgi:GTP-binding protein Era
MTSHPVRFLCAEIIREQAMLLLRQELPYSLAVEVEDYKDMLERGIVAQGGVVAKIRAAIIVEKDSQKGIVIGAGGKMIKEIGSLARAKIETIVGGKVFLELYVRVVADWTKDAEQLKRMGYE